MEAKLYGTRDAKHSAAIVYFMNIRKILGLAGIVALAACAGYGLAHSSRVSAWFSKTATTNTPVDTLVISLEKDGFHPASIRVAQGAKVTFVNHTNTTMWPASNLHPTHEIYPEFDPKAPVLPGATWAFTFTKSGVWRYHDHLRPTFTGSVLVGDIAAMQPVNLDTCKQKQEISEKEQCWDEAIEQTVATKGLDEAFRVFSELYESEPGVPKACHGWAHVLGKAAFDLYSEQKSLVLKKETEYCGYGFFHGFIERLLQTTGNVGEVKKFCEYASKQLPEQSEAAYANCIHGIGHGSVSVDNPALFGNFQAMLDVGLKSCDAALTTAEDRRNCHDGAFNAMELYEYDGEYGLTYTSSDPFGHCRTQKEEYKISCYFEYVGPLVNVTNHDFKKASRLIDSENVSAEIRNVFISRLAADFMLDDLVKPTQEQNVRNCRAVPKDMRESCFKGVVNGFIAHGEPGKEYVKALAFCHASYLEGHEKDICYQIILGHIASRDPSVCAQVPEQYKNYCY